jgi:hypothetical protein
MLGTLADNGYTISAKTLLVLVFPGSVILIEGKANILKKRAKLDDEPMFRALVVLDGRAGTLLANVEARFAYDESGALIDIHGGAEAFFDFSDASHWHLYLGQNEPTDKRIRAEILSLFEANIYFMIDPARCSSVPGGYDSMVVRPRSRCRPMSRWHHPLLRRSSSAAKTHSRRWISRSGVSA